MIPARGIVCRGLPAALLALRVHPQLAKVMSFFVAANCYLRQSWQSLLSLAIERALNRGADELLSCSHQQRLIKECHHQLSFSHLSILNILVCSSQRLSQWLSFSYICCKLDNSKKCSLQNCINISMAHSRLRTSSIALV